MRFTLAFLASLLLVCSFGVPQQQNSDDSCGFVLEGGSSDPSFKGPDDLVPLLYLAKQPDSPLEIVSVDLEGMWLQVSNEQHTEKNCAKYKVRNRSNRTVQKFIVTLRLSTSAGGGGTSAQSSSPLAPGQAIDVGSCGVTGSGGAENNHVRLLVYVDSIDLGDCLYKPSLRVPRGLKIYPGF
jgi:hypothetical protein